MRKQSKTKKKMPTQTENIIKFSVVALHKFIPKGEDLESFRDKMIGKTIILRPDPGNAVSDHAVEVLHSGKTIGFVRDEDAKTCIRPYLLGRNGMPKSAKVVEKDKIYKASLVASVVFEGEIPTPVDNSALFNNWKHCWEALPEIEEWEKLDKVVDSMLTLLKEGQAEYEEFSTLIDIFRKYVVYGFSSDLHNKRREIYKMLDVYKDERVRSLAAEVAQISPGKNTENTFGSGFSRVLKQMKKEAKKKIGNGIVDTKEIQRQLSSFPFGLYDAYKKEQGLFSRKLYYASVPRKQLDIFLSGIAIVGYVEGRDSVVMKKSRKRGRPKEPVPGLSAMKSYIRGESRMRNIIFDYIKDLLEGKMNKEVAAVMVGAIKARVVSDAPFRKMEASFGHIGNREYYNKWKKYFLEHVEEVDHYKRMFEKKWEEVFAIR